jgi:hypothetical protein
LLDENIELGWVSSGVFVLIELDGLDVLLAPPDQLFFSLALHHMLPNRSRRAHEDAHDDEDDDDAQEDEAAFASPSFEFP